MNKIFLIFISVNLILFFCRSEAAEQGTTQKSRQVTLSICAIVRNEAKYLKEWIEFHRLVGVEHFYLYNNNSTDLLQIALNEYIKKGIVTLIHWPDYLGPMDEERAYHWALSTQVPAYENAIKFMAAKKTKWLALLNTDEYLVPVEPYTIKELLSQYDSYPAIVLTTDVFDASVVSLSPPRRMITESRDLIKSPKQNFYHTFEKIIVKPDLCSGCTWPPYRIIFKKQEQPIVLKRSDMRINRYANRDKLFLETVKHKAHVDTRQMPASIVAALLEQGYAVEDQEQAISRFLPDLKNQCIGGSR
jgi:hypothetical protein